MLRIPFLLEFEELEEISVGIKNKGGFQLGKHILVIDYMNAIIEDNYCYVLMDKGEVQVGCKHFILFSLMCMNVHSPPMNINWLLVKPCVAFYSAFPTHCPLTHSPIFTYTYHTRYIRYISETSIFVRRNCGT